MGTGPGFFAIVLAELGYKVTAYDANHEMLEQAKLNAKALAQQIKFDQGDAQEVIYADNSFDVVISRNLTWILPQPEIAYKEWCRVLKPHGLLINFDANWYNYLYDEEKKAAFEQDRIKVAEQNYEDHYLTTDMETMERLALQVPLSAIIRPA
jgi:ubiquinone/menaquinone biosynthesis C-methylase UbiE